MHEVILGSDNIYVRRQEPISHDNENRSAINNQPGNGNNHDTKLIQVESDLSAALMILLMEQDRILIELLVRVVKTPAQT